MPKLLPLLLLLPFCACQSTGEQRAADSIHHRDSSMHADSTAKAKADSVKAIDYRYTTSLPAGLKSETWEYFSNEATKDHFELIVPKGKVAETKSILRVTDAAGNVLYDTSFTTLDLVNGYTLQPGSTEAETIQYYAQHVTDYFKGAIDLVSKDQLLSHQPVDPEVTDAALWEQLKANPKAKVFIFYLNEESDAYLVYSPKLKRLVAIAYCC